MYNEKLWEAVIEKGKKQEKGITHKLSDDEIDTILATAQAMGVNKTFLMQAMWDLTKAKYKLYDWIAMLVHGRYKGYGETPDELENQRKFATILAKLYIEKSIPELIDNLRRVDYQLESSYKSLVERADKKLGEVI